MIDRQFTNLETRAAELLAEQEAISKKIIKIADDYIKSKFDTPIIDSRLENLMENIQRITSHVGAPIAVCLKASKAHTNHKRRSTLLELKKARAESKDAAAAFGKSMFTAEDIINGALNVADGLVCVHRGELISEIGICLPASPAKIQAEIERDLIKSDAGSEVPMHNSTFEIQRAVNNLKNLSLTYLKNSEWMLKSAISFSLIFYHSTTIGLSLRDMLLKSIVPNSLQKRTPIFKLERIPEDRAKLISAAFLVVKKQGASDYIIVEPKNIKVVCSPNSKDDVCDASHTNKGVLLSKIPQSKQGLDISFFV